MQDDYVRLKQLGRMLMPLREREREMVTLSGVGVERERSGLCGVVGVKWVVVISIWGILPCEFGLQKWNEDDGGQRNKIHKNLHVWVHRITAVPKSHTTFAASVSTASGFPRYI